MMIPEISIIVPIYNGERYLSRCIESILAQTYEKFELILINDGSKDTSESICKSYAGKDERVVVHTQKNAGVSVARNTGLDLAKGKYIAFVDCDDWLDKETLATLYRDITEKGVDLSILGYREIGENGTVYTDSSSISYAQKLTNEELMFHLFRPVEFFSFCYPWGKLFKKDIIRQNGLYFNPKISIGEDRLFIFEYCLYAKSVYCSTKAYCNYFVNNSGAMRTLNERYLSCFKAMELMRNRLDKSRKELKKVVAEECVNMLLRLFKGITTEHIAVNSNFIAKLCCYANYYVYHVEGIGLKLRVKLILYYKLNKKHLIAQIG